MAGTTQDNSTETKTTHWEQPWGILCFSKARADLLSSVSVSTGTQEWKTLSGHPPFISQNQPSEAATERKEKMARDCCSAWQRINSHMWILSSSAKSPWIVWDSCQSVRCKYLSCTWKIRVCAHGPEGTRAATCPWTPSSSKCTEEQCYHVYCAACLSAFYMHCLIMISIRSLTSSNIKILQLFPLSKKLTKFILESRWALLSVPMKILFTMLYISRCDIISGTSHSPHLQWTTVLICVLGGEDLAAESHDVTLMLYYFTIACK